MKKFQKFMITMLIAALVVCMGACGDKNKAGSEKSVGTKGDKTTQTETQTDAQGDSQSDAQSETQTGTETESSGKQSINGTEIDPMQYQIYAKMSDLNEAVGCNFGYPATVVVSEGELTGGSNGKINFAQSFFTAEGVECGLRFCNDTELDLTEMVDNNGEVPFTDGNDYAVSGSFFLGRWVNPEGQYVLCVGQENKDLFDRLYADLMEVTKDPEAAGTTIDMSETEEETTEE